MSDQMTPGPFPSWDDFRFFLATTKAGSFSKAAHDLGVTQPTMSRRIENLEHTLGVRLFDRLPNGVMLTSEGERILDSARQIEDMVFEIQRNVYGSDRRMEGNVRISVPDGIATYWLTPHLREFQEEHPSISIELLCSVEPANALKMETDLAFRFQSPQEPDLIAVKLATLHFLPWASPEYLERHGTPRTTDELLRHRWLDHSAYYDDEGEWSEWFALARVLEVFNYRTSSTPALVAAVQRGLGIALLPNYACEVVEGIVPLDLGLRSYSKVWLVYHPGIQSVTRVQAAIAWVRRIFSDSVSPWFGDEYCPPTVGLRRNADRAVPEEGDAAASPTP